MLPCVFKLKTSERVSASRTFVFPSAEANIMRRPPGEQSHPVICVACESEGLDSFWGVVSHTLSVPSFEAETSCWPFGENARAVTLSLCPASVAICFPLCVSQTLIVLAPRGKDFDADTNLSISGE